VIPDDHLVRKIGSILELSWVYAALAPYYSKIGRPSIGQHALKGFAEPQELCAPQARE